MNQNMPRLKKYSTMVPTTRAERQAITLDSIKELEAMLERGDIEPHAYFIKKRALIRLL